MSGYKPGVKSLLLHCGTERLEEMTRKLSVLAGLLLFVSLRMCAAESWVVFQVPDVYLDLIPAGSPTAMIYTLENDLLTLNTNSITAESGSSTKSWTLLLSGTWAAFGTVDSSGVLTPDPYATFVPDGYNGFVRWVANTPSGYTAPLLLGWRFVGHGAATYEEYVDYQPDGVLTTGTIVLWSHLPLRPHEQDIYTAESGVLTATNVPEPGGFLALMTGFVGLAGLVIRRRRRRRFTSTLSPSF